MKKVFKNSIFTFIRVLYNVFGLSCFTLKSDELKVSSLFSNKNLFLFTTLFGLGVHRRFFMSIDSFLLNDQRSRTDLTDFSTSIFFIIGDIPILTACFIIFNHFIKRREILQFLNNLDKIDKRLKSFGNFKNFCKKNSKCFFLTFGYLMSVRLLNIVFLFRHDFWVFVAYTVRFVCECNLSLFILAFSFFIKYATFLIENLNSKAKENNGRNFREISFEFQAFEKMFRDFFSIFHCQIVFVICYLITNIVLTVRNSQIHLSSIQNFS